MIDLKEVITKYPECLESAAKLKSYLADLYPEEKARCSILATIFDVGIAEQIKNGKVDNLSVDSYCNSLEDTYGYAPRLIRECISIWGETWSKVFDANEEVKTAHQRILTTPLSKFVIEDDVLTWYYGTDQNVTIPSCIKCIGKEAFKHKMLKSIVIPSSVTTIGDRAFSDCKSLESIEIPNSVTEIGQGAFQWCESLESIEIPDNVTEIGEGTFQWCKSLENVKIPNSVIAICKYAFWGCGSLESIEIPDNVAGIGDNAFRECKSLKRIEIPNSVTAIGENAFLWCKSLTIKCNHGSYAEQYAKENGIDTEYRG